MDSDKNTSSSDSLRLLTMREAALLLGVEPQYVMRHATVRQPLIRSIRLGRFRRFRRSDIDAFIESQRDHNPRALAGQEAKSKK